MLPPSCQVLALGAGKDRERKQVERLLGWGAPVVTLLTKRRAVYSYVFFVMIDGDCPLRAFIVTF